MSSLNSTKFLLLLLVVNIQCSNESRATKVNCSIAASLFQQIALQGNMLSHHLFSQVVPLENREILVGYNHQVHQLEFIDLTDQKVTHILKLKKTGPEGIPGIYSFYHHNFDSIFVFNFNKLMLLDSSGRVSFSRSINTGAISPEGLDFSKWAFYNTPLNACPMYYDQDENSLYFPISRVDVNRFDDEYFTGSLCGRLDLNTYSFEQLPIYYSDLYKEKRYTLDSPNITFEKDRIIYNFPNSPDVYVFDKHTQKMSVWHLPAGASLNEVTPLALENAHDQFEISRNISLNTSFYRIIHYPGSNWYFRLHHAPYEGDLKGKEGIRGYLYLMIFDQDFNILAEERIDGHRFTSAVAVSQGLLMNTKKSDEDQFQYTYFSPACPN